MPKYRALKNLCLLVYINTLRIVYGIIFQEYYCYYGNIYNNINMFIET